MRVSKVRLSPTGSRWLNFDDPVPLDAVGSIERREQRKADGRMSRSLPAAWAARRATSAVPHDERAALAREYLETDVTLQEIADRYGVTREYMRLIVNEIDSTIPRRRRARRRAEREAQEVREQWAQLWEQCGRALAEDRRCVSCGGWVIREIGSDKNLSCSHECYEAWKVLRIFDDPDSHRRAMARVYLASPEKYRAVNLEWAERMLSDDPPPRNRVYLIPDSKRAEVIRKYRPEAYAELMTKKP